MFKRFLPLFFLVFISFLSFYPFFLKGKLPIPSDTIVGLYYPFRDLYVSQYPRGIPFKNFMVTDPVRQQYPWKKLTIDMEKRLEIPLWNPYTFAGQPLMGNFQSGALYPINVLFFILPFPLAWSTYIYFQPILGMLFMFLFLRNLELSKRASAMGAISFSFGGFFVSWFEWGTIIHTALWLPLILFFIDKILKAVKDKVFNKWSLLLVLSFSFSFLAGHLQVFFYSFIFSLFYLLFRLLSFKERKKPIISYLVATLVFLLITSPVLYEGIKFIFLSARGLDQDWRTIAGWFVPWQNAVQVIIPDFFGNPATLNYYGVWNYGEFVSYIGVGSFIFALYSLLKKDRNVYFFVFSLLVAIIFAFPTLLAKIPFKFELPLISTSQPTRLVFIIDFCLSILAAYGFNFYLASKNKIKILIPLLSLFILFCLIWGFVVISNQTENILVTKSNLIFPTFLFVLNSLIISLIFIFKKNIKVSYILSILFIIILVGDLLRFEFKYMPFTDSKYLFPNTKITKFLMNNLGNYRIMATDSRIFPPNFSIMYKLQSIDGYDPLYLQSYAEFSAALERGSPDIHSPFGFNRIITPQNFHSSVINLLGVKYVISISEVEDKGFKKVFQEGSTFVYENEKVLPRAFFISSLKIANNKQETIDFIFNNKNNLDEVGTANEKLKENWSKNRLTKASITNYSENSISIETDNTGEGFLILTDNFYPTWKAKIDDNPTKIYLADYTFRGIVVPKGKHTILFYNTF